MRVQVLVWCSAGVAHERARQEQHELVLVLVGDLRLPVVLHEGRHPEQGEEGEGRCPAAVMLTLGRRRADRAEVDDEEAAGDGVDVGDRRGGRSDEGEAGPGVVVLLRFRACRGRSRSSAPPR